MNGKSAMSRAMKVAVAAGLRHIGHRRVVAGHQQVIAVIHPAAKLGIEEGSAAAARALCGFVQADMRARLGEAHGSRESGEAGADHMDPASLQRTRCAHRNPYRKASQIFCHLGSEMRANGSRQSALIRRSRMAR